MGCPAVLEGSSIFPLLTYDYLVHKSVHICEIEPIAASTAGRAEGSGPANYSAMEPFNRHIQPGAFEKGYAQPHQNITLSKM